MMKLNSRFQKFCKRTQKLKHYSGRNCQQINFEISLIPFTW
jgi:hypothetical protein